MMSELLQHELLAAVLHVLPVIVGGLRIVGRAVVQRSGGMPLAAAGQQQCLAAQRLQRVAVVGGGGASRAPRILRHAHGTGYQWNTRGRAMRAVAGRKKETPRWTINIYATGDHKTNQLGIKSKPQSRTSGSKMEIAVMCRINQ